MDIDVILRKLDIYQLKALGRQVVEELGRKADRDYEYIDHGKDVKVTLKIEKNG